MRHAMSRVVITRPDAGKPSFNYSGVFGMAMGIALSNAFHPARSVNGSVDITRVGTSLVSAALSNILPEFWSDIKQKFFRRKQPYPRASFSFLALTPAYGFMG
jgi:hypothetical protein